MKPKKNLLIAGLMTVAAFTGVNNSIFAQDGINFIQSNPKVSTLTAPSYDPETNISPKVVKDFKKQFCTVNDEKWIKLKDGYTALFSIEDTRIKIRYNSKGNWISTEKFYKENKLDADVRRLVKSDYFDYSIVFVREINLPETFEYPIYIIHIDDSKSFKNISVFQGEIRVLDEYLKG